jgi:hypothetical protein
VTHTSSAPMTLSNKALMSAVGHSVILTIRGEFRLHAFQPCRRKLDVAHIPVVYGGHLTIVPGDRDRVPRGFRDAAAVGGIASPANPAAFPEVLRFGHRHVGASVRSPARRFNY